MPQSRESLMQASEETLSLHDAANLLLEECRTILPGIQALFGFQLIAVFNAGFDEKLAATDRVVHLAAIVMVAIAIILIMTPAAYHRQTAPMKVESAFIVLTSRAVLWAMFALMLALTLDFFLVAKVILGEMAWASSMVTVLFGCITLFWFVLPRLKSCRKPARRTYPRGRN